MKVRVEHDIWVIQMGPEYKSNAQLIKEGNEYNEGIRNGTIVPSDTPCGCDCCTGDCGSNNCN